MALVKSGYLRNAEIYATNNTIWTQLANIVDNTGKPMFIPDVTNGTVGKLFGIPVYEEDGVADGEVFLADVQDGYAINVNEDVSMYFEDHVKARNTDYMAYSLVDGTVLTTKAFGLLRKKSA
jgi:HK97 family phage major capsid protein